jgi:hypothetical protein
MESLVPPHCPQEFSGERRLLALHQRVAKPSERAHVPDGDKPPYMDLSNATARFVTTTMRLHRLCRPFGEVQQDLFLSSLTIG